MTFCYRAVNSVSVDVVVKKLNLPGDKLRFVHMERKAGTLLLLDASGEKLLTHVIFTRGEGTLPTDFRFGLDRFKISRYTVLDLPDYEFYHLDELPDGTWRICHTSGLFAFEHSDIEDIVITPAD